MPVLHENIKNINSALTETFEKSQKKNDENFGDQLIAATKRVLFTKIEYEEATTQTYTNVFDKLKNKYNVLKLAENKNGTNGGNSSYLSQKSQEKGNGVHGNERNGTGKQIQDAKKENFRGRQKKINCSTFSVSAKASENEKKWRHLRLQF